VSNPNLIMNYKLNFITACSQTGTHNRSPCQCCSYKTPIRAWVVETGTSCSIGEKYFHDHFHINSDPSFTIIHLVVNDAT
jgi:hypothetical protein